MYGYNTFPWTAMNQWPQQNQNLGQFPGQTPIYSQWPQQAQLPYAWTAPYAQTPEITQWLARIESQITLINQTLQSHAIASNVQHASLIQHAPTAQGYAPAFNQGYAQPFHSGYAQTFNAGHTTINGVPYNTGLNNSPLRLRESDTHIFCDIFLPQLTMGDVEVEVSGNRIVCRTRVPVPALNRQFTGLWNAPRGFEFFELPDGRLECSWLCPVLFHAKDVEATFREGFLSICVPKAETTAPRQTVKITQEKAGRRTASEMNS